VLKMTKIIITDSLDNKKTIDGQIVSFSVKTAKYSKIKGCCIYGLDTSWKDKKILCILIENDEQITKNFI